MTTRYDDIVVDGSNVNKANLRGYFDRTYFAVDLNDIRTRDLHLVSNVVVAVSNRPVVLALDATDTTSSDNGTTIIVDSVGSRFKAKVIGTSDLTAAVLNGVFGTGGLSADALPTPGFDPAIMGHDVDGHWSPRAIGALVTWLDTFIGSTTWRTTSLAANAAATVKSFPTNTWKNGCDKGGTSTALLFADGQVGYAGISTFAPDDNGAAAVTRYMKIPFTDAVQRTITKFWAGYNAYYALDSNGIIWSFGANGNGQLGLADLVNRTKWTEITFFRTNSLTVSDVTCNSLGAYFTTTSGLLYYTGYNGFGQAGNGNTTQQTSPVRCGTLTSVTAVYPGSIGAAPNGNDLVGAVSGGTFYTWGRNDNGELGIGNTTSPQSSPVSTGITGVTKACMGIYSLLMKSDNTIWSCGINTEGGTGQSTFTGNTTTWTQIAILASSVVDIAGATGRFCPAAAISVQAGSRFLYTWGYNGNGNAGFTNGGTSTNFPGTPTGSWQGSVDEIGSSDQSAASGVGQLWVRVGNRILTCGYNGNANLINGTQSGNTSQFGDVMGILGNIQSWYVWGRDSATMLSVMTDQGVYNAGCNTNAELATHEYNLHNTSVLQPILVSSLGKGVDGTNFVFDAIGTLSNKTTYDSQPAGFRYVAYDDSPTAKMYQRVTTVTGTWTSGVPVFGSFALGTAITPSNINTTQNNYAPTGYATCGVIRQGATSDCRVTGLQGGATNRVVLFTNLGTNTITLGDEDSGSTAANRFALDGDLVLPAGASVTLWYDNTASRWVSFGVSSTIAPPASSVGWDTRSKMQSSADGFIELLNNALSAFTGLRFGGTSNAFPMWKRVSTALTARLADDSGDAPVTCSALSATSSILSSATAGGVGYSTGAGGTVTQATSKATGVTLSKMSGAITLNAASLAAATIVSFVLTNTSIAATDVLVLNHISGGTPGSYTLNARAAAGSATIDVRNNTAGALAEAIVIQFAVIKAVNA